MISEGKVTKFFRFCNDERQSDKGRKCQKEVIFIKSFNRESIDLVGVTMNACLCKRLVCEFGDSDGIRALIIASRI